MINSIATVATVQVATVAKVAKQVGQLTALVRASQIMFTQVGLAMGTATMVHTFQQTLVAQNAQQENQFGSTAQILAAMVAIVLARDRP